MTLKEIARLNNNGSWARIEAVPSGLITTKEQYNYILQYPMDFHRPVKHPHTIPTFEECKGKYLGMTSFFGGAAFYFILQNSGELWSWGDYGRVDFSCRKCKYEEKYWNNEPCINCCGCDKFEEKDDFKK